jgi:hypothetical protein
VLDLVKPIRGLWRLLGRGWQARLDKAHPCRQRSPTLEQTCKGAAATISPAPAGTFLRAEFFSHFRSGVMAKRPAKTRASNAWGTKSTPERTERLQFKVSTDEIAAIDEFRFQTRMPNRATAIRELLRRGLGAPKQSGDNRFKARNS